MKIYDKACWHIDAGENKQDVIERLEKIFYFLKENSLLNNEGLEIVEIGIDSSASLHERLLTPEGKDFLDKFYEQISFSDNKQMNDLLKSTKDKQ